CSTTTTTARASAKITRCGCSSSSSSARTQPTNSRGARYPMQMFSTLTLTATALFSLSGSGATPAKKLSVVATTPDLASIAREIGGAAVEVTALAKPTEDPHFVDPKPSHLVTLNRAD